MYYQVSYQETAIIRQQFDFLCLLQDVYYIPWLDIHDNIADRQGAYRLKHWSIVRSFT